MDDAIETTANIPPGRRIVLIDAHGKVVAVFEPDAATKRRKGHHALRIIYVRGHKIKAEKRS